MTNHAGAGLDPNLNLQVLSMSDPAARANMMRHICAFRIMLTGRKRDANDLKVMVGAGFGVSDASELQYQRLTGTDGCDRLHIRFDVDDAAGPPDGLGVFRKEGNHVPLYGQCRLWAPAGGGRPVIIFHHEGKMGHFAYRPGKPLRRIDRLPAPKPPSRYSGPADRTTARPGSPRAKLVEQAVAESTAASAPSYTLAVPDPSHACLPGQFTLSFTADRQWVRHEVAAWSVGLKWVVFQYDDTVYDPKSPLLKQGLLEDYLAGVEQLGFAEFMREHLDRHIEMHQAALLNGLKPGGRGDLPTERILIDRLLNGMVGRAGIDLHGPAEAIGSDDRYIAFLANSLEYMGREIDGRRFQLRQAGLGLPIISTFMPIGRAAYSGHALDLDHPLPETVCTAAVGWER